MFIILRMPPLFGDLGEAPWHVPPAPLTLALELAIISINTDRSTCPRRTNLSFKFSPPANFYLQRTYESGRFTGKKMLSTLCRDLHSVEASWSYGVVESVRPLPLKLFQSEVVD